MKVTERGGTKLGSLLSNKNLWSGMECGRQECRTCTQEGGKREDCVKRNILYESECERCADVDEMTGESLKRQGQDASLFVGESARSLFERSSEHWKAAEQMKEESHMVQHSIESHNGESKNTFKFKVVKSFRSALDRQIAEAIRIEMSGSILNRRGEFNRCSLTRLGFDKEWEDDRWKKSWERVEAKVDDESLCLIESQDAKGPGEVKMTGFQEVEAGGWCQGVGGKSGSLPSTA